MAATTTTEPVLRGRDWRLRASMGITLFWLLLGFLYIQGQVGWADFVRQRAPDLGGFLEGAFAPLAFLWLVVGFFLQQRQLEDNTRTIERQLVVMQGTAEQAEVQARAIAADEMHSRQDVFMRTAAMVDEQLGVICGFIVTSYLVGVGPERMTGQGGGSSLWTQMGGGDNGVFDRHVMQLAYAGEVTMAELFWGTEIRTGHTQRFLEVFERLLAIAGRCDPDGIIADALREGHHGRTYTRMIESRPS